MDFAIDTDNAVVTDPDDDAYDVVDEEFLYQYDPPADPSDGVETADATGGADGTDRTDPTRTVDGSPTDDAVSTPTGRSRDERLRR